MSKRELVDEISQCLGQKSPDIKVVVDSLFTVLTEKLSAGEKVMIPGFGTFEVTERKARTGRNPNTGETIKVKASKVVHFKAGKILKESVNN